ncbi:ABC transporter permease [Ruegeria profundi]|uniref:ABC transporter permease n=1 Tax=Ruegeria profundi TaxID=1685378 RepID=UPI001CD77583|nr:ABC transporter permease [Ruegeria profundi]MCA0926800.1 ABC transporter permease [Ruegeria profundi]
MTFPAIPARNSGRRYQSLFQRAWQALWVLPLPVWLLLFFAVPLGLLVAISFWSVVNYRLTPDATLSAWRYVLGLDFLWASFWRSYGLSLFSAVAISLLAFPASYAMAFVATPRQRLILLGFAIAPFFTSYLVRIYSWQVFLAEGGVISSIVQAFGGNGESLLNTYFALFIGHATLALPVVLILQTIALANVDRTEISAAANLGARPGAILFRVILPAARPGLTLGLLFAFLLSYAEFVSAAYLGGGTFQTLPILVTDLVRAGQQWPRAAVVSLLMIASLLVTAFVTVLWAYREKG